MLSMHEECAIINISLSITDHPRPRKSLPFQVTFKRFKVILGRFHNGHVSVEQIFVF